MEIYSVTNYFFTFYYFTTASF